jgi:hypothetical protein
MADLVADAAKDAILEVTVAVSADDDEVCILPVGDSHESG